MGLRVRPAIKAGKEQSARPARRVFRASKAFKAIMGLPDRKARPDHKVWQARPARLAQPEILDLLGRRVRRALKAILDRLGRKETKAFKVTTAQQDRRALQARPERRET